MATLTSSAATPEPAQGSERYAEAESFALAVGLFWFPELAEVVLLRLKEAPKLMATTELVGNDVAVSWVPECPYDEWTRGLAEQSIQRMFRLVGHVRECDQ